LLADGEKRKGSIRVGLKRGNEKMDDKTIIEATKIWTKAIVWITLMVCMTVIAYHFR